MRKRRLKILFLIVLTPILLLGVFLLVERIRGQAALARYKQELISKGEKLSASEMMTPVSGENGAPEVFKLIKEIKNGTVLTKHYLPKMSFTPSGHAVIGFRESEWIDDKVTNDWSGVAADLKSNEKTLAQIRAALDKPVLNNHLDFSQGFKMNLQHEAPAKSLIQWFGAASQLALHNGQTHAAVDDLIHQIRLPLLLAEDQVAISELVRIAIAAIAKTATWEALQADGWTDEDLAKIQEAVQSQEFASAMARSLEGERVFDDVSFDLLRKSNDDTFHLFNFYWVDVFSGDEGAERSFWQRTLDFLKKQVYCRIWRFAWLDQDQHRNLKQQQHLIEIARRAVSEKSFAAIQPAIAALDAESANKSWYDKLRYPEPQPFFTLSGVVKRAMRAETERSMTECAIALKRYSLRHGKFPTSLDLLVPEFVVSVPIDYMDGKPLRYRLNADGSFTLYSVGEDGKDDGGDTALLPDRTSTRNLWDRKDFVWPSPATPEEVEAYRKEAASE